MEKHHKKRGRPKTKTIKMDKKISKKKLFDIKNIDTTAKNEYTNLLVHLPIDIRLIETNIDESFEKQYLNYENMVTNIVNEPVPFEELNNITEEKITYEKDIKEIEEKIILQNENIDKKVYTIEKTQENILCWWCCHSYDNQSYGIPLKKEKDTFLTKGFFCSLNCAKSYNVNENIDIKEKQNRNLMLDMLNEEICETPEEIKLAPPRETLKVFGGVLKIEDFRGKNTIMKLIYPPLITIIPYIEENIVEEQNNNVKINKNLIKNNLLKLFN